MSIDGIYEIIEMEVWNKDAIDLVELGYISIKGKKGQLHFICVDGQMKSRRLKTNTCSPGKAKTNVIQHVGMENLPVQEIP